MSQYGSIKFFTEQLHNGPIQLLRSVIAIFSPGSVEFIFRRKPSREWEEFLAFQDSEDDAPRVNYEHLPKCAVEQVPTLLQPDQVLSISFGNSSQLARSVYEDNLMLPEDIRGTFNPWSLLISIGEHDLFDGDAHPFPVFFGRAVFCISITGQGSPSNRAEYRRRVWELPAVVDVMRKLKPLLSPMKTCAFWSI